MNKKVIEKLANKILLEDDYYENQIDIIKIAERKGFKVCNAILKNKEDGFIMVDDTNHHLLGIPTSRLIGVNTTRSLETKRFIIACELGAYLLQEKSEMVFAHRKICVKIDDDYFFGACLLLPKSLFQEQYAKLLSKGETDMVGRLATIFQVPCYVVYRCMREVLRK